MLTKILLGFTMMCNFATLLGLWIAYEAAPATLQARVGHVLTWSGATASAMLYFLVAWLVLRTRAHEGSSNTRDSDAGDDDTDFRQLFLDEQSSREKYQDQFVMVREERDQLTNELEQLKAQKPDTTLKDSDPKIEIEFRDERSHQGGKASLTTVNRGSNAAKCIYLEPIRLKEHTVSFPTFSWYLPSLRSENLDVVITRNDGQANAMNMDFLGALHLEYRSFNDEKLHELIEPVIATYQDHVGNLFQTRCELVFSPSDYAESTWFGKRHLKAIEIRNQASKKIAAAIF
jgi:hypothetical protein